jgi:hypothetical protein
MERPRTGMARQELLWGDEGNGKENDKQVGTKQMRSESYENKYQTNDFPLKSSGFEENYLITRLTRRLEINPEPK